MIPTAEMVFQIGTVCDVSNLNTQLNREPQEKGNLQDIQITNKGDDLIGRKRKGEINMLKASCNCRLGKRKEKDNKLYKKYRLQLVNVRLHYNGLIIINQIMNDVLRGHRDSQEV